jgi:hypothetical protein
MALKETFTSIISNDSISSTNKLILLWILMSTQENIYCNSSNKELAEILNKHHINISKAISELTKQNLLIQTTIDRKRILTLNEITNPLIIKNNKINNSYLSINISIKECDQMANDLIEEGFLRLDYNSIGAYLLEKALTHPALKVIKNSKQLTVIIRSILKGGVKEKILLDALDFEYDLSLLNMQNVIRKICGYEAKVIVENIDEDELRKEKNERRLRKSLKKSYQEKTIDISKKPAELQKIYKGQKLVTIEGNIHNVYEAGDPPFCNISLKTADSDQLVYASIQSKHFPNLKTELDGYQGAIRLTGQVTSSKFHKERYDVQNIIKSIDELEPIEFSKRSNLINTRLTLK